MRLWFLSMEVTFATPFDESDRKLFEENKHIEYYDELVEKYHAQDRAKELRTLGHTYDEIAKQLRRPVSFVYDLIHIGLT